MITVDDLPGLRLMPTVSVVDVARCDSSNRSASKRKILAGSQPQLCCPVYILREAEEESMIREKIMCSTYRRSDECGRLEQVERGLGSNDPLRFPSKDDDVVSSHLHLCDWNVRTTYLADRVFQDTKTSSASASTLLSPPSSRHNSCSTIIKLNLLLLDLILLPRRTIRREVIRRLLLSFLSFVHLPL